MLTDMLVSARTLLFVPGNRPDRFNKAAESGADAVVIDLEDSVGAADKLGARRHAIRWIAEGNEALVRVNPVGTPWHEDDVVSLGDLPAAVMIPKSEHPQHVALVGAVLGPDAALIPLIETAKGVLDASAICSVPGVHRVAFGNIDLAAELGVDQRDADAVHWAQSQLVLASAAAGCASPIDGVTPEFLDDSKLRADVARAVRLGFTGKLCIHPSQIRLVHEGLVPSQRDVDWAKAIVKASSDDSVSESGGEMIDRPVVLRAKQILGIEPPE